MKIKSILAFAAAMALSFATHAHECSGGAGGGMDATGNQCNDESAYSAALASATAAANPAVQFGTRHEHIAVAGAIKPVAASATGASYSKSAAQRAPKKYSHRATKRSQATAG